MSYQIVDSSDTQVTVVENGVAYAFKKTGCSVLVRGDYLIFVAAIPERNVYNVQFQILYSDCTNPSEPSAIDLETAVNAILDSYAGGGGGGFDPNKSMAYIAAY